MVSRKYILLNFCCFSVPVSHFYIKGEITLPIFQPDADLFNGLRGQIPPVYTPTQEPRILSRCLQYLQSDFYDDWITGLTVRTPDPQLLVSPRANGKKYKMDAREVVISRLEWLFFVNEPTKHNLLTQ